jgi:hypothetical protein
MTVSLRPATLLVAIVASLLSAACGADTSAGPDAASASPATAAAANLAVTWRIQEGSSGGSVSASGLYTAPTGAGTYHVIVTSAGDTTKSATSTVTVTTATQQVAISISPTSASVATAGTVQLTATVTGTSNASVNWSVVEGSAGGSVSGGVYTAPSTAGTYHVQAQSQADTTKTATATITVTGATTPPTADCATAPLRSTGTTYYYCDCGSGSASGCRAGNDTGTCTNPATPCRSFSSAMSKWANMAAGDTVALCRGGAWDGATGDWYTKQCSNGAYCDFRDYVPSGFATSSPRPRINTSSGTMLWGFSGPATGLRWWNLDIRAGSDYSAGNGIWFATGSNWQDIDMCNLRVDGSRLHVNLSTTGSRDARWTVRNSEFDNTGFSAFLGTPPGTTFDSNVFVNNGQLANPQQHTIYFVLPAGTSSDAPYPIVFKNNSVTEGNYCAGVMLVVHETFHQSQVIFENNLVTSTSTDPNCYGIQASSSAHPGDIQNMIVRRNRIQTSTNATPLELSCCTNCTATDNVILGGNVWLNGNSDCNGGVVGTAVTFQNNTVYGAGVSVGSVGQNYVIENNAIYTSGTPISNSRPMLRPYAGNVCTHAATGCSVTNGSGANTWWVNPTQNVATADFHPTTTGPLIGAASSANYSTTAMGATTWQVADPGEARRAPVDAGAYQH